MRRRPARPWTGAEVRARFGLDSPLGAHLVDALAKSAPAVGLPRRPGRGSRRLVALDAHYAVVCRLIACRMAERADGERNGVAQLARRPAAAFRRGLAERLSGCWHERRGIHLAATTGVRLEALADERPVLEAAREVVQGLAAGPGAGAPASAEAGDLLRELYEDLIPATVRHATGEYFTPDAIAQRLLLATLGPERSGDDTLRVLDPTCGSGTFLVAWLGHLRRHAVPGGSHAASAAELLERILAGLAGMDANPLALLAAEANLLAGIGDLLPAARGPVRLPLLCQDVLAAETAWSPFDVALGNPPWVNWEDLSGRVRRATRSRWVEAGLFTSHGMAAILGRGKKDLALLVTLTVLARQVRDGGRLGFVLPESAFRSAGGARGFRRFRLPDGTRFAPEWVEDVTAERPFAGAAARAVLAVFEKGRAPEYPVPFRIRRSDAPPLAWDAEPVDPADPTSPWLTAPAEALAATRALRRPAAYTAREGVNTGGANAVYWLELLGPAIDGPSPTRWRCRNVVANAKRKVAPVTADLEPDLVYPLLRGRDVARWRAAPSLHLLLAQDPETRTGIPMDVLRESLPRTAAWLERFETDLRARKSRVVRNLMARGSFASMFGVSRLTLAPWKVVWRELAQGLDAAVVGSAPSCGRERPVVPDHTCVFVPCAGSDEAHFLCAALDSAPVRLVVRGSIVLHPDPHLLSVLAVPAFAAGNLLHARLAGLSREAHRLAADGSGVPEGLEAELDAQAARLWGIGPDALARIRAALAEGK